MRARALPAPRGRKKPANGFWRQRSPAAPTQRDDAVANIGRPVLTRAIGDKGGAMRGEKSEGAMLTLPLSK